MGKKSTTVKAPTSTASDQKVGNSKRNLNTVPKITVALRPQNIESENKIMNTIVIKSATKLFVKACLIIAAVALYNLPVIDWIIDIAFYQMIAVVLVGLMVYIELAPAVTRASVKEVLQHVNKLPSDYIET